MALPPPFARSVEPRLQRAAALVRATFDHVLVALSLAKLALVILGKLPRPLVDALGKPNPGQILKALDLLLGADARALRVRTEILVADDAVLVRPAPKRPIDLGPLLALDDPLARLKHLALKARPELARRDLLAPRADALAQIIAVDLKRAAVLPHAANEEMDVRVVGVVMVDCDPFEPGSEIALHPGDQLADVVAEIQALGVLGRDDEAPHQLVAASLPRPHGRDQVDSLARRIEAEPLFELSLRARTREVLRVRDPRAAFAVARERRLDDAAPRVGAKLASAALAPDLPPAKASVRLAARAPRNAHTAQRPRPPRNHPPRRLRRLGAKPDLDLFPPEARPSHCSPPKAAG